MQTTAIIDLHDKEDKRSNEFEILLVPGGMIVYRTMLRFAATTQFVEMTATYVPFREGDEEFIRGWLYMEKANEQENCRGA